MDTTQGENDIWIGKAAMARLVDRFNVGCPQSRKMRSSDAGAGKVAELLTELMAISGVRLRLVREHPDNGREELDLSSLYLAPVEGLCETDKIEAWLRSGAALTADATDLTTRKAPMLETVS